MIKFSITITYNQGITAVMLTQNRPWNPLFQQRTNGRQKTVFYAIIRHWNLIRFEYSLKQFLLLFCDDIRKLFTISNDYRMTGT